MVSSCSQLSRSGYRPCMTLSMFIRKVAELAKIVSKRPLILTARIEYGPQSKHAFLKYKSLVRRCYKVLVDGQFEHITDNVLKDL